jgi:8-oxo-dGTP pyrophosphatase MutT (NUDIX family)
MYRNSNLIMPIFIHHGQTCLSITVCKEWRDESNETDIIEAIKNLKQHGSPLMELKAMDEGILLEKIRTMFHWIEAAGGVLRDQQGRFLLIHRRGYWDLPKGKIDAGENPLQAAGREIEEETGVGALQLEAQLTPTYHIYKIDQNWFLKKTHWFLFEADAAQPITLQREEDIEDAQWMPTSNIRTIEEQIYPSLLPLLKSVIV